MIDTHCHLLATDYENIDDVVARMGQNKMITAGIDDKTNYEVLKIIKCYKNVYGVIGIHPNEVGNSTDKSLSFIEKHIMDEKIVGIGEIGLDYHYGLEDKEKQILFFKKQLDMARAYNKTVVIHSRDASEETYQIMKEYPDVKMVLHCYSGSVDMAKKLLKLDVFFGIGGVLTFKNGKVLKEVVSQIPLDHIVLETDSPYLTPEPFRGEKNEPKNIILVAQEIARIKNITVDEVLKVTTENAIARFDLK